jgi:hypothetical protein
MIGRFVTTRRAQAGDVHLGSSFAFIAQGPRQVRFSPTSGRDTDGGAGWQRAKSGLLRCNKEQQYSMYLQPYLFERRQVAGAVPNAFLKAREKAASEL